jgi:DNA-binding NarL/FixJ family response regulator
MIRVLLADDQELIRSGLRTVIDGAADMTVVAEASTGGQAVTAARATRPDVVVMDIRMPGGDGLTATRMITSDDALAAVRVLILTTYEVDEHVLSALQAGASGFLGKGASPGQLRDAVRTVASGDSLLSPAATKALISTYLRQPPRTDDSVLRHLTARESEVVVHAAQGLSNTDIAARLKLSPLTVKTHLNRAMAKLGARDRAQLVVIAYQTGLAYTDLGARDRSGGQTP